MSSADLLSTYFDRPDWARSRSSLRTRPQRRSYNPLFSWEGRSDDPRSFARLAVTHFPSAPAARPLCLSGAAVIELEDGEDAGSLTGYRPELRYSDAPPLSKEQASVGMAPDLSGAIPRRAEARLTGARVVTVSPMQFRNMRLLSPRYEVAPLPPRLASIARGEDLQPRNPRLLRELNEFEARQSSAERDMRQAVKQRMRTRAKVEGTPFYSRSSSEVPSKVDGSLALRDLRGRMERHHRQRRDLLARLESSIVTNGSIIAPDTMSDSVSTLPPFQSKRLWSSRPSYEETKSRLFEREVWRGPSWNIDRALRLRDQDLHGKDFNFVSHTSIAPWPTPHMTSHSTQEPEQ